jgi:hypothetical protein
MCPHAVSVFNELADRSSSEREDCYARRAVPAEIRAEV